MCSVRYINKRRGESAERTGGESSREAIPAVTDAGNSQNAAVNVAWEDTKTLISVPPSTVRVGSVLAQAILRERAEPPGRGYPSGGDSAAFLGV